MEIDRRQFMANSTAVSAVLLTGHAASASGKSETISELQIQPQANTVSQPKVLIIIGDATETVDTLYPYYRLIEGGYKPVVAAPEKRRYQMVLHEVKPGWTIT